MNWTLIDSKLLKKFWGEALATATYIRNRSPTKALQSMTSCETWTGVKPNVSHFKVFGFAAYSHAHADQWQKLNSKFRRCVLFGYGKEIKGLSLV